LKQENLVAIVMENKPRVLGIGGSPRKDGNSDLMLREILKGSEEQGLRTEIAFLRDYQFSSCVGCEACRTAKACPTLLDGMQLLYPRIIEARGLVLASPAHNYNVSALMKAFIDRLYQFYDFTTDHPRAYSSRLAGQGRKAVVAGVAEQLEEKDMGFTMDGMRLPLEALGYEIKDRVSALGHFHKGKVAKDPQTLQACFQAGRKLGMALRDSYET
jgi:multimeric flavodoxin WrbA